MNVPRSIALAAMVFACAAVSTQARAQLFDFLFGAPEPAAPSYEPALERPRLKIRVRPEGRSHERPQARRPLSSEHQVRRAVVARVSPAPAVAPALSQNVSVRQIPIDPVKVSDWHLQDPTLRRGDIVVHRTGTFVYSGNSGPAKREDFVSLASSPLVSKGERDRILKITGPGTGEQTGPVAANQQLTSAAPSSSESSSGGTGM